MSILAAFLLALVIALLFAPGYRRGSFSALILFFLILFFAGLAGQYWIIPFGPVWLGISWGRLLFIVLIFAFLFSAPSPYERRDVTKTSEAQALASAGAAISVFIWFLFLLLAIAILIGVFRTPAL